MIKLRQCKEDFELTLFKKYLNQKCKDSFQHRYFLYFHIKELDIWPSKELIIKYMPEKFSMQYSITRVIRDAAEIHIQKTI